MSGGIGRVFRDAASDYIATRKELFGVERIPFPRSLQLSETDRRLNLATVALDPDPLPV